MNRGGSVNRVGAVNPRTPLGIRIYHLMYRVVWVRIDAERAHHIAAVMIALMGRISPLRALMRRLLGRGLVTEPVTVDADLIDILDSARRPAGTLPTVRGWLRPPGVLGVAAGFDKAGRMAAGLVALGFGFVEVGTVTAQAQPGNPRPRLQRVVADRAVVNRMGFNNDGAAVMEQRLAKLRSSSHGRSLIIGVNIGKTKLATDAVADYRQSARVLARYADYLVVNVSSPNTPGLRDLQAVDELAPVLDGVKSAVAEAGCHRLPILVKIAPDLADEDIDAVAELVIDRELAGVVATNTTIAHDHGAGGLSGVPLHARALSVVTRLRDRLGPSPVIMGVGGIDGSESARAMLEAGADVVQAYTAFIYEGPTWPGRVNRELDADQ